MRKSLVAITSIVFHFLVIASIVVGSGVLHELADEKEEDVKKCVEKVVEKFGCNKR